MFFRSTALCFNVTVICSVLTWCSNGTYFAKFGFRIKMVMSQCQWSEIVSHSGSNYLGVYNFGVLLALLTFAFFLILRLAIGLHFRQRVMNYIAAAAENLPGW